MKRSRENSRARLKFGLVIAFLAGLGILATRRPEPATVPVPEAAASSPSPVPAVAEPVLPDTSPVAVILDPESFSYEAAIRDLASMSTALDAREQRALLREIEEGMPVAVRSGLEEAALHHLANDCVFVLLRQEEPLPELAPVLIAQARDDAADPVLRDYAVQALGEWLERPRTRDAAPEGVPSTVVEALFGFVYEDASLLAGTALLSLDRVASLPDSLRPEDLVSSVLLEAAVRSVILDESAAPASRASALLIGQRHDATGVTEFARSLLADTGETVTIRAAAATVLGSAGDWPTDRPLLEPLADPADSSRLGFASRAALARLKPRS